MAHCKIPFWGAAVFERVDGGEAADAGVAAAQALDESVPAARAFENVDGGAAADAGVAAAQEFEPVDRVAAGDCCSVDALSKRLSCCIGT